MKLKTSELTGPALDWAVANCEKRTVKRDPMALHDGSYWVWEETPSGEGGVNIWKSVYMRIGKDYKPSTNWAQGGPIIEREKIAIRPDEADRDWLAEIPFTLLRDDEYWSGPTPLVAALRCYVASRLGDMVDVPDELINPTN